DPSFADFILATEENPIDLLTKRTWSDWKEVNYCEVFEKTEGVTPEINAQARLSLVNSPLYLKFIQEVLNASNEDLVDLTSHEYAESFYQLIWNKKASAYGFDSLLEAFEKVRNNQRFKDDLNQICEYAMMLANAKTPVNLTFQCPLELHGVYSRQEIFAAFGKANMSTPSSNREGVMHIAELDLSLHLLTFKKTEKYFSETTSYRDYPISRTRIHWESQSQTPQDSKVGQRYLSQAKTGYKVLVFARLENKIGKLASPLMYLGLANLVSAYGNKPIEMVWDLESAMPYDFYLGAKVAAGI
ncbi:DUF3427 domain-containing protein, partial [Akkermansiaceae bacterium]|nr:DUF3427 domain-containing protein [Akkermansiaceae bacterium]